MADSPGTVGLSQLETANLAMLDGDQIVYVGQVPSRHSMRMFTEMGRRVTPHCTAVGKALLALEAPADVFALLSRTGMEAHTEHTITDPGEFAARLVAVAERGYAMDDASRRSGSGASPSRCPTRRHASPRPSPVHSHA